MPQAAAVTFFVLCAVVVAFGGVQSARRTSHAMGVWILRGLEVLPLLGPVVSDAAIALTKLVTHELGEFAAPKIRQLVRFVAGLTQYVAVVGYWSLLWPVELYRVVSWLVNRAVPQRVKAETLPLAKIARMAAALVKPLPAKIIHAAKAVPATAKTVVIQTVPRSVREASREIEWLRRHYKALAAAVAGAGAIALPWGGAGRIERETKAFGKRLGKLERLAVGLGAVTVLYRALRRIGWKCMPRRKTGRLVCGIEGMDNLLLDVLLAEIGLAAGLFSIRALTRDLQAITPAVVDGLGYIVSEAPREFHSWDDDVLAAARALIPGA